MTVVDSIIIDAKIYDCNIAVETRTEVNPLRPSREIHKQKNVILDASEIIKFINDNGINGEHTVVKTNIGHFILERNGIFTHT